MKLKLHDLREPVSFSFNENEGWLQDVLIHLKLKARGPLSLHVKVTKQDNHLFVEGHLVMTLALACSRCTNDVDYAIDEFFSPVFVRRKNSSARQTVLEEDELDTTYFSEDEVDFAEVMHEQMALMIPVQPLCQQNCKGLCPQCGEDLNVQQCDCKKEITHSQFDVLKTFKVRKKGG